MLFGLGLCIGGMTQPARITGFLDFAGAWDPSLLFVMIGAIGVYLPLYRVITRRKHPIFDPAFALPTRNDINTRVIAGAAVFGVGWGLGGYCPGPALTSLATGYAPVIVFTLALIVGIVLFSAVESVLKTRGEARLTQTEECG
jgi:uncharacterized membrane protein YedE/YeeE